MQTSPFFQPTTSSPHVLMSTYAQPMHTSGSFSPLHFPLSSPPLHIPPSLQELDMPTSNGFRFGLVRRDRTRQSGGKGMERRGSAASVETLPEGTLSSPSYSFEESTHTVRRFLLMCSTPTMYSFFHPISLLQAPTHVQQSTAKTGAYSSGPRRPLTTANLLLRRSSSVLSLTSPTMEHDDRHHYQQPHRLPALSRTNSVSTCSSSGEGGMLRTPPHHLYEDFEVLSEEDEEQEDQSFNEDAGKSLFSSAQSHFHATTTKSPYRAEPLSEEKNGRVVLHASPPPALLKRPGLPRRDTPIPLSPSAEASLSSMINKPAKSFTTTLTPIPTGDATPLSVTTITEKPRRPVLKRRDTPRPVFEPISRFTPSTIITPTLAPVADVVVAAAAAEDAEDERGRSRRTRKVPNFFSTSLRRSLRASSSFSSDDEQVVPEREEQSESPISISSSSSEESFTSYAYSPPAALPLSEYVLRSTPKKGKSFSSVLDGKVWISV